MNLSKTKLTFKLFLLQNVSPKIVLRLKGKQQVHYKTVINISNYHHLTNCQLNLLFTFMNIF